MNTHHEHSEYVPAAHRELDPQHVHEQLMQSAPRRLAFDESRDPAEWRTQLAAALRASLGREPEPVPLDAVWDPPEERDGFTLQRVEFSTERDVRAVGWFMTPTRDASADTSAGASAGASADGRRPTVIALQGHSSGAHISFGELRHSGDAVLMKEEQDFGVQAVRCGFNAFALEQRGFGERMDSRPRERRHHYDYTNPFTDERCRHQAMVALLLGRTLIGERVFDVRRAIDLLETRPEVDTGRIACVGNSGGGSATYYAACVDERIAAAMPGCSVCSYGASIGRIDHCSDNYLPGALESFDMGDLAGLIAPRPLVVVASDDDPIFPYSGVTAEMETVRRVYARHGHPDRTALFTGRGGHRFFAGAWDVFRATTGW